MIPVEYVWFVALLAFCAIGAARGLAKELGTSAVLMISLFTLHIVWSKFIAGLAPSASSGWLKPAYFGIAILVVAYISYEGYVLSFPVKQMKGLFGSVFGLLSGLLNGYLIAGTLWDLLAQANYYSSRWDLVSGPLSGLHNTIAHYLPLSLMQNTSPFVLLVPGVLLILLMLLK
ncbi:MAG TPA: hypothetical protein PKO09_00380 [Anaerolineae bacterium]|nr:hypothetical protein [Anaerolineae bacterium]